MKSSIKYQESQKKKILIKVSQESPRVRMIPARLDH